MLCLTQISWRVLFEVIYAMGFMEWEALSSIGQAKMVLLLAKGHCVDFFFFLAKRPQIKRIGLMSRFLLKTTF